MRRAAACLLLLVLGIPTTATAEEHSRVEKRSYATTIGTATVCQATEKTGAPVGWGGSCFTLDGESTHASISIDDMTGPPVQGHFDFLAEDGTSVASGGFCDSVEVTVPGQARMLRVYVDGFVDGFLVDGCGVGVAGTITATFS